MRQFEYKAVDASGKTITANINADSVDSASKLLISRDLYPFSIEPVTNSILDMQQLQDRFTHVKATDRVIFTRQLATLIKAGLPIANAMGLLIDQIENPKLKDITKDLSIQIQGGTTLGDALRRYPDVFNKIYVSIIDSGEVSGKLDEVLVKLADQEERNAEINRKIKGALTYPAVILIVILLVAGIMVSVVLPEVGKIYEELNQSIPAQTQLLLSMADFFAKYWWLVTLLIVGSLAGTRMYLETSAGRSVVDRFKLNVPAFKTLIRKLYMSRFASTLSSLVNSGVPMLHALEVTSGAINNIHLEQSIKVVSQRVKSGNPLSKPLSDDELFLPLVGKMVAVGEETGSIGDSLEKVAGYYQEEVDQAVDNLSSLIEPITMVVLGLLIAFLVGAVLMPIYGIVNASA